jgi:hypothetical protein
MSIVSSGCESEYGLIERNKDFKSPNRKKHHKTLTDEESNWIDSITHDHRLHTFDVQSESLYRKFAILDMLQTETLDNRSRDLMKQWYGLKESDQMLMDHIADPSQQKWENVLGKIMSLLVIANERFLVDMAKGQMFGRDDNSVLLENWVESLIEHNPGHNTGDTSEQLKTILVYILLAVKVTTIQHSSSFNHTNVNNFHDILQFYEQNYQEKVMNIFRLEHNQRVLRIHMEMIQMACLAGEYAVTNVGPGTGIIKFH